MIFLRSSLIAGLAFLANVRGQDTSAAGGDVVASLTGKGFDITHPGESTYDSASGSFNLRFSYKPSIVAYPETVEHISEIVKAGHDGGYNVVARSGGHSYIAAGVGGKDGSIVIDMRNFKDLAYDAGTSTATIGVGNRLGHIITFLESEGRAIPHGTCPDVGWGGHVGYGGFGFTARMWGFALDPVISMDVVLANGTITTASETHNPDLFWALRGASGSFGIVTSTQVQTFEMPSTATTYTYKWELDIAAATTALNSYQEFAASNIPKELGIELLLGKGDSKGSVSFSFTGVWYGGPDELASVLQPLLDKMGPEDSQTSTPGTYLDSATTIAGGSLDTGDGGPGSSAFYAKSLVTPEAMPMTSEAHEAFMTYVANEGFDVEVDWFFQVGLVGGQDSAVNAVASDATSCPHRGSQFIMQFYAYGETMPEAGLTFLDGTVKSILDNSPADWEYGAYTNYADDRLDNAQSLYYKNNLMSLEIMKVQFDPTGVFNSPTGIEGRTVEAAQP